MMRKYSLCLMDDNIPAMEGGLDDTEMIGPGQLLKLTENKDYWNEEPLRLLVENLLQKKDVWDVFAFTNPIFYLDRFEEELFRPDIMLFDWEYQADSGDMSTEECLIKILNDSFVIVLIFTGVDNSGQVTEIIESDEFKPFVNRVEIVHKDEDKAVDILMKKIEGLKQNNFAFKFGNDLKASSIRAVNKILIELGKVDIQSIKYFGIDEEGSTDLVDFIAARYKNYMSSFKFDPPQRKNGGSSGKDNNPDLIKRLWSHRLYFLNEGDYVCRGDIVINSNNSKAYIVISAACDLVKFWNKNWGHINLIPLHKIDSSLTEHLADFKFFRKTPGECKKDLSGTSLTSISSNYPDGTFIMPFVPVNGEFINYIGSAKEITSIKIDIPSTIHSKDEICAESLKYSHWPDFHRICMLSEPFITPLIEKALSTIGRLGVPDFGDEVKELIKAINKVSLQ